MALVELRDYLQEATYDLRYGTTNNILGEAYPNYPALLEEEAALSLREIEIEIGKKSLVLVIWDAWRPQIVHDKLMEAEPDPRRVNPKSGHLIGVCADLNFAYRNDGQLMDTGCDFDEFDKSNPNYPGHTVVNRSVQVFQNDVMTKHGWIRWPEELFHYGFKALLRDPESYNP